MLHDHQGDDLSKQPGLNLLSNTIWLQNQIKVHDIFPKLFKVLCISKQGQAVIAISIPSMFALW